MDCLIGDKCKNVKTFYKCILHDTQPELNVSNKNNVISSVKTQKAEFP